MIFFAESQKFLMAAVVVATSFPFSVGSQRHAMCGGSTRFRQAKNQASYYEADPHVAVKGVCGVFHDCTAFRAPLGIAR